MKPMRTRKSRARAKLVKRVLVGLFVLIFTVGIAGMAFVAGR